MVVEWRRLVEFPDGPKKVREFLPKNDQPIQIKENKTPSWTMEGTVLSSPQSWNLSLDESAAGIPRKRFLWVEGWIFRRIWRWSINPTLKTTSFPLGKLGKPYTRSSSWVFCLGGYLGWKKVGNIPFQKKFGCTRPGCVLSRHFRFISVKCIIFILFYTKNGVDDDLKKAPKRRNGVLDWFDHANVWSVQCVQLGGCWGHRWL